MQNKLPQLDTVFQAAFCTVPIPPGESATCQCGQVYKSTLEAPLSQGEVPGGLIIVSGCDCDASGTLGGMLWRYRQPVARFLSGMVAALAAENARLLATVPAELLPATVAVAGGVKEWKLGINIMAPDLTGKPGRMACGSLARCLNDDGKTLLVSISGLGGVETCYRSAFTEISEEEYSR